jgi:hypothetical protein
MYDDLTCTLKSAHGSILDLSTSVALPRLKEVEVHSVIEGSFYVLLGHGSEHFDESSGRASGGKRGN